MPERHGLPLIVKFSLLAFGGLLVLVAVGLIAEAVGGSDRRDRRDYAAQAAACHAAHGGSPYEHLRYPYTALPVQPDYSALQIEVPPDAAVDYDVREVSRDSIEGNAKLLGTALYVDYGDDSSDRDTFLSASLDNAREAGVEPRPVVVHGHPAYLTTRPTKDPNNIVLGSLPCGTLLVLADTDHAAEAVWRRLAEPPADG